MLEKPFRSAVIAIDRTPFTGRTLPSRASSPTITCFFRSSLASEPLHFSIPRAIGRSNAGPTFFMSAGARFTSDCVSG